MKCLEFRLRRGVLTFWKIRGVPVYIDGFVRIETKAFSVEFETVN